MWKSEKEEGKDNKDKDAKELVAATARIRLQEKFGQSSTVATTGQEKDEWSDDVTSTSASQVGEVGPPNPEQEAVLELLVEFKELWAKISLDPTENSVMSDSLNLLWGPLNELQTAITADKPAAMALNHKAPGVLAESQDFLNGRHTCHQNPARKIRDIMSWCRVDDLLDPPPSQAGLELLARWDKATFSSRI